MVDSPSNNRLRILRTTALLDSAPERAFDRLAALASRLLNAPVALVSLVDENRQFFKSAVGLGEPWASRRETPLTHSFCKHVTETRTPLIVTDAREHPELRENKAIPELSVIAYAGIPLFIEDEAIGAFCVADDHARSWSDDQIRVLGDLAASVISEIELRMALRASQEQHAIADQLIAQARRNEAQYRAILRNLPNGAVFTVDRDLRYLSADGPALENVLATAGITYDQLIGQTVADLAIKEDRAKIVAFYQETMRGKSQRFEIQRQDRWFEVTTAPLTANDRSEVESAMIFSYDVTDRKRSHDALARQQTQLEQFRSFVEHVPVGVNIVRDGQLLYGNPMLARMLGYESPRAMLGRPTSDFFVASQENQLALKELRTNPSSENVRTRRLEGLRRDGSKVMLEISVLPFDFEGAPALISMVRDAAAEIEIESLLSEKTSLLQEIHHRVKNNLQMISSLLNLQARQIHDDDARAIFMDTQSRVRSIALLHESLYQSNDLGKVDLREYFQRLSTTVQRAYGSATPCSRFTLSIEPIHLAVDGAVPCGLIVNELITNALKHAFAGREGDARNEIQIDVRNVESDVVISVSDNGHGFAGRVKPEQDETMGLMLVRDLSQQLRGKAIFSSENGARCVVRFPQTRPQGER